MKWFCTIALASVGLIAAGTAQAQVNKLTDGGFEDASKFTQDGAPFVGFWEAFNGGAGSTATRVTTNPRTGAANANFNITSTDNTFAGAFQDVTGLTAGQSVTYSGWQRAIGTFDIGAEYRIEWRNNAGNTEISRNNTVTTPTATYSQFSFTGTVPAGADTARVVYAIQSFGAGGTNNGTVSLDDVSLSVVPEPACAVLAGFGLLALGCGRSRRK